MTNIFLFSHLISDQCLCLLGPIWATFAFNADEHLIIHLRVADIQAALSLVLMADSDHLICPL